MHQGATYRKILLAALVLLFCISGLSAQEQDSLLTLEKAEKVTTASDSNHSVKQALIYSLIPGGGQVYNRKYWKVPLVYATMGTTIYFTVFNNRQYHTFLDAFNSRLDSNQANDLLTVYTPQQLIQLQDQYRRWRDLSIILTVAAYGLQMLDAYVDAHLYNFDIDDDLSLRWEPAVFRQSYAAAKPALGLGITLSF